MVDWTAVIDKIKGLDLENADRKKS